MGGLSDSLSIHPARPGRTPCDWVRLNVIQRPCDRPFGRPSHQAAASRLNPDRSHAAARSFLQPGCLCARHASGNPRRGNRRSRTFPAEAAGKSGLVDSFGDAPDTGQACASENRQAIWLQSNAEEWQWHRVALARRAAMPFAGRRPTDQRSRSIRCCETSHHPRRYPNRTQPMTQSGLAPRSLCANDCSNCCGICQVGVPPRNRSMGLRCSWRRGLVRLPLWADAACTGQGGGRRASDPSSGSHFPARDDPGSGLPRGWGERVAGAPCIGVRASQLQRCIAAGGHFLLGARALVYGVWVSQGCLLSSTRSMATSFRRSSGERDLRVVRAPSSLWLLPECRKLVQALVQAAESGFVSPGVAMAWRGGALEWGSRGRRFESSRPDQRKRGLRIHLGRPRRRRAAPFL